MLHQRVINELSHLRGSTSAITRHLLNRLLEFFVMSGISTNKMSGKLKKIRFYITRIDRVVRKNKQVQFFI